MRTASDPSYGGVLRRLGVVVALGLTAVLVPVTESQADEPVQVVTSTSDLAAITRAVGGDDVEVYALCSPEGDAHFRTARPTDVRRVARADLFVVTGAELEIGWAPVLVEGARRADMREGGSAYFDASAGLRLLEVPTERLDRSQGHVHAKGNPHYLVDPVFGKRVAVRLAERLAELDPDDADDYRERARTFSAAVDEVVFGATLPHEVPVARLERRLASGLLGAQLHDADVDAGGAGRAGRLVAHAGRGVVHHHGTFLYLATRCGLKDMGRLEPKPGMQPTPRHIVSLTAACKDADVPIVLRAEHLDARPAEQLAERIEARVVALRVQPRADQSYVDWVAANLDAVIDALEAR